MRWKCWIAGLIVVLALAAPAARAAVGPPENKLQNPSFETGAQAPWFKDGGGLAGIESCCGQRQTFFWPSEHYNIHMCPSSELCGKTRDWWDGYIEPAGQYVAFAQGPAGMIGSKPYRLSTWLSTYGMTGYLRWYAASGGTRSCSQTNATFPAYVNTSCYFTMPSSPAGFNVHLAGSAGSGAWVVSDDWALTEQKYLPVDWQPGIPKPTLPISYWALDYGGSTDTAAGYWNSVAGRTLFVKAGSLAAATLVIDGIEQGDNLWIGHTGKATSGKMRIEVNIWYFNQWSTNAKVSTLAHELGHALMFGHVNTCQALNAGSWSRYWFCGLSGPTPIEGSSVNLLYPSSETEE
jgi:hypothetical protein